VTPRPTRRTLVSTKFSPPEVAHAAIRPEVIEKIAVAGRRKLLIVCAPAGYGKTTLLAEAGRRLEWPTVWYKLDALDHDPLALIASLAEGIRRQFPDFGDVLFERLENANEIPLPAQEMLTIFLAELEEAVDADLHIVLDDYHEAADSPELNSALSFIVERLPASLHLCVLTRYEPLFATAKLRLSDELAEVGVDDLRFDADQIAATLAAHNIRGLEVHQLQRLAELTEGWPASVVLAGKALEWSDLPSIEGALADPRLQKDIYSYLAEQVLQRESAETQAFLMSTCCLDHITVELANAVADIDCAQRLLSHLEEKRVFTFASADRSTYRYHNLFRDYLRHRCMLESGTSSFRELQLRTAKVLESASHHEAAVELYLAANCPDVALDTVARAGEQGIENSRSETIRSWLDRLPPQMARTHPWANFLHGQVLMREGKFDEALAHFANAEATFTAVNDESGLYQTLSAMECTLYWKDDLKQAIACCRRALQHAHSDVRRLHTLLSMCAISRDACEWTTFDPAIDEVSLLAGFGPSAEVARLEAFRQASVMVRGSYRGASHGIAAHRDLFERHGAVSLRLGLINLEAVTEYNLGRYAVSGRLASEGLETARRTGYRFLIPVFEDMLGQQAVATGDFAKGRRHIVDAVTALGQSGDALLLTLARNHEGTAERRYGDLRSASTLYERELDSLDAETGPYAELTCLSNRDFARGLLGVGSAIVELEDHAVKSRRVQLLFIALKCEFFIAVLEHRSGNTNGAISRLRTCIPQQLELGHINFLSQELLFSPELALDLIRCEDRADVLAGLLDTIALHWDSAGLLARMLPLGGDVALGALRAAARHRSAEETTLLAARARRHRSPAVRSLAAQVATQAIDPGAPTRSPFPELTDRELQVLTLMAAGHKNIEIAGHLYLSPATVKTHVNRIFSKLGVDDRVQAILRYNARTTT
jgi:LuxR family maltose regulon positive regulatory protein